MEGVHVDALPEGLVVVIGATVGPPNGKPDPVEFQVLVTEFVGVVVGAPGVVVGAPELPIKKDLMFAA